MANTPSQHAAQPLILEKARANGMYDLCLFHREQARELEPALDEDPNDLQVGPDRGDAFYAEVRRYWPDLPDGSLQPGYAGMRPKISGPHEPAADFMIQGPAVHGLSGLVNLFGIESPGLTSCLTIAQQVATLV